MYGILRNRIWSDLTQKVNLANSHGSNLKSFLMNYQDKIDEFSEEGQNKLSQGFTGAGE